jgi:hypothetical protein
LKYQLNFLTHLLQSLGYDVELTDYLSLRYANSIVKGETA